MIPNLNPLDYSIGFKERSKELYDHYFYACWNPHYNGSGFGPVAVSHFKTIEITRAIVESIIEGNRNAEAFNIIYWYGVLFQLKRC